MGCRDRRTAVPVRDARRRERLAALAGTGPAPSWAPGLAASTPDDLVVVTFSGHGLAPEGGAFHLMLEDIGRTDDDGVRGALRYAVSEGELTDWLRPIQSADMALVVDACQSAASVEGEGFKPGPLGSRGFGQIAYDKRMLVLAASQSDAVALESAQLKHGLLTWALVKEGIEGGLANLDTRNSPYEVTLREWLEYGEARVPALAADVVAGRPVSGARGTVLTASGWRGLDVAAYEASEEPPPAQQPRLFAFGNTGSTPLFRDPDAP